jgi:hypothetical protein
MNTNEIESRINSLESMLFRVIDFMSIGADKVALYEFITYETVKRQLELDYILMEKTPASSFNIYCQHSLFQVENLLNYYYALRFKGKIPEAMTYFNLKTNEEEKNMARKFRVSQLSYGAKFTNFAKEFLSENNKPTTLNTNIQSIAYVRHSTVHRNSYEIDDFEMEKLKEFQDLLKKENTERTKEDWDLFNLGRKIQFKQNTSFSLVKRVTVEFVQIIKPLIVELQRNE